MSMRFRWICRGCVFYPSPVYTSCTFCIIYAKITRIVNIHIFSIFTAPQPRGLPGFARPIKGHWISSIAISSEPCRPVCTSCISAYWHRTYIFRCYFNVPCAINAFLTSFNPSNVRCLCMLYSFCEAFMLCRRYMDYIITCVCIQLHLFCFFSYSRNQHINN